MHNDKEQNTESSQVGWKELDKQIEFALTMADKKNEETRNEMLDYWETLMDSDDIADNKLNHLLDKIHKKLRITSEKRSKTGDVVFYFQRVAAILIFPLCLSFFIYYSFSKKSSADNTFAEIECPLGTRTKFKLPDGTSGSLNSGARLKFPVQFKKGERRVELLGEAYFDVFHDSSRPFHVNTPNLDIQVLGTSFNVDANEDETSEEVVLKSGLIDVSFRNGERTLRLKPDELLLFNKKKNTWSKKQVEAEQYVAWKDGKLIFRNEGLKEMAQHLSKWFNAEVIIDEKSMPDYTFYATFKNESLEEVLRLLSLTTPFSYKELERKEGPNGEFLKRRISIWADTLKTRCFKLHITKQQQISREKAK